MLSGPVERIVLVGTCVVDNILKVPHYPAEDEKLRCTSMSRRRGGNTPNSAEVLQQLISHGGKNIELILVNVLPARGSAASDFIAESLGPGVNLDYCIYREGHTEPVSCYIISSAASDSRTIVTHNELPEMTLAEFTSVVDALERDSKRTVFHFEGRNVEVTRQCMYYLAELANKLMGKPQPSSPADYEISLEIEKPGRPGLEELAGFADIVFYSKAWVMNEGYADAHTFLSEHYYGLERVCHGFPLLVCTWGEQGSSAALHADDGSLRQWGADAQETKIVDPVGAGDTFTAAFLYATYSQDPTFGLDKAQYLAFANRIAARKISQDGFQGLLDAS